jgi:hypothetical protein
MPPRSCRSPAGWGKLHEFQNSFSAPWSGQSFLRSRRYGSRGSR